VIRRVAYLTGRYPAVSHTFITREVLALRGRGWEVPTFSIWRTPEDQLLSTTDRDEAARTHVLLPATQRTVAEAQRAAAAASPAAYAQLAREALTLGRPGARGRMVAGSWVLEAATLWHACAQRETTHIHAHLNGTAPAVAMLAARLGNAIEGGRRWTWSNTVHGPTEFYDVVGEALPAKVRDATFTVCISDFARSQLMAFVEEQHWDKLHVVHCGVDPRGFTPVDRGGREGPLRLLSVGRLTQIKGQAVMLDAVARLKERGVDVHLEVVGDGPRRDALERITADLGVDDRTTFAGAIGQDRIREWYDRADAFVLSSFAEGIPVVLMEAMACELPVVAPGIMGIRELVEDGQSGRVVRPGRTDELAAALEDLTDAAVRRRLGAAAREKVLAEFEIGRSAEQLAELFETYALRVPVDDRSVEFA
jgi:glycosyltransferase involved in cell wall biosynthesis